MKIGKITTSTWMMFIMKGKMILLAKLVMWNEITQ